jgi:hypothetical protein
MRRKVILGRHVGGLRSLFIDSTSRASATCFIVGSHRIGGPAAIRCGLVPRAAADRTSMGGLPRPTDVGATHADGSNLIEGGGSMAVFPSGWNLDPHSFPFGEMNRSLCFQKFRSEINVIRPPRIVFVPSTRLRFSRMYIPT